MPLEPPLEHLGTSRKPVEPLGTWQNPVTKSKFQTDNRTERLKPLIILDYLIWQCIKQQCSALLWLFGSFLLCTNISYLIHNLYKLKRVTVCDCDTSGALKNEMRSLRVCVQKNRCFSKLSWCCTGMTTILQAPRVLSKRLRNQSFARVRWMTCKESLFNLTLVGVSTSLHN